MNRLNRFRGRNKQGNNTQNLYLHIGVKQPTFFDDIYSCVQKNDLLYSSKLFDMVSLRLF